MRRASLPLAVRSVGLLALFCGCSPLVTDIHSGPIFRGLTYSLPSTVYTVSLTRVVEPGKGDVGNLVLAIKPKRVATPGLVVSLRSDHNIFFDRNHSVSIDKGLLSTISITDTGKLTETIVGAAESIVAVQSGGMSAIGAEETIFAKGDLPLSVLSDGPSREELDEFIKLIPNDGLTQDVLPGCDAVFEVPGTDGALYLRVTTPGARHGGSKSGLANQDVIRESMSRYEAAAYGLSRPMIQRSLVADGVLARSVTSGQVTVRLLLRDEALRSYRTKRTKLIEGNPAATELSPETVVEEHRGAIASQKQVIEDLETVIDLHLDGMRKSAEEVREVVRRRDEAEAALDLAASRLSDALAGGPAAARPPEPGVDGDDPSDGTTPDAPTEVADPDPDPAIAPTTTATLAFQTQQWIDKQYRLGVRGATDDTLSTAYDELSKTLSAIGRGNGDGDGNGNAPGIDRLELERKLLGFRIAFDAASDQLIDKLSSRVEAARTRLKPLHGEMASGLTTLGQRQEQKRAALEGLAKDRTDLEALKMQAANTPHHDFEIFMKSEVLELIDTESVMLVPMYRSAFGESKTTLSINEGVVTKADAQVPSEALEVVKIPKKVVEAILDTPKALFLKKSDQRNEELNLRQKELDLLKKEAELRAEIEKQRKDAEEEQETDAAESYFAPAPQSTADPVGSVSNTAFPQDGDALLTSPEFDPTASP